MRRPRLLSGRPRPERTSSPLSVPLLLVSPPGSLPLPWPPLSPPPSPAPDSSDPFPARLHRGAITHGPIGQRYRAILTSLEFCVGFEDSLGVRIIGCGETGMLATVQKRAFAALGATALAATPLTSVSEQADAAKACRIDVTPRIDAKERFAGRSVSADIRYTSDVEMARGPMVKSGTVVRGTYRPQSVVGVDSLMRPSGGDWSLRGAVPRVPDAAKVPLRSAAVLLRRQPLHPAGPSASRLSPPRSPKQSIRSVQQKPALLGAPVDRGTRIVAFSADAVGSTRARSGERPTDRYRVRLQTGVGRGLAVIEGGKPAPLGCAAYAQTGGARAARPRTFVGWDGRGRWRSFTVPGSTITDAKGSPVG